MCLLFCGCQSPQIQSVSNQGPVEVSNFGKYDQFPEEVAGLRREKVIEYQAPLRDYSIGYNIFNGTLSNAVTFYFYPVSVDKSAQLRNEVAEILRAHPNGHLRTQRTTRLEKSGSSYEVFIADFEYTEAFGGRAQSLWSRLVIVFLPNKTTFKVRSTAPIGQETFASEKLSQLLDKIQWER